jgi:radical SAM protein with 4Fe4S-binding SPASM domain
MDWFGEVGIDNFRVNFLQPQGRGADESQLLTGDEMFEGMRQVLDHMDRTQVRVDEAETLMMVNRFLHGRDPRPSLSCWEVECQAGRIYCAVDHRGTIHACGTDLSHHPLGNLDEDVDDAHYRNTLLRLHNKGDWVIRCFDCAARKICRHSCPTSDYNSDTYKEHECRYTKLMFQHLSDHPDKAQRIERGLQARRGPPLGATFVPASELRVVRQK